jgi:hypothetical protein
MNMLAAVALGALTGLHAASWGAYKDSPFEGFRPRSFVRSILAGAAASFAFWGWQAHNGAGSASIVVWVGAAYALERLTTEWWKAFLRIDDQTSYTIPMRIAVGGNPIERWSTRSVLGLGVVAAIAAAATATGLLHDAFPLTPAWLVIWVIGGMGGWATAIGGAWKDAPIEGFSGWKFVRSPVVATTWAVPVSMLTNDWFLLVLSAGGLSVASIETYKSFFTGGRPPGKFASKPKLHHLPEAARRLGHLHASLWALLGLGVAAALSETPRGTSVRAFSTLYPPLPTILLASIALGASALAVLVVGRLHPDQHRRARAGADEPQRYLNIDVAEDRAHPRIVRMRGGGDESAACRVRARFRGPDRQHRRAGR